VPVGAVLAFVAFHIALKAVFFSAGFLGYVADPVYDLTRGLVTHSATAGLIEIVVLLSFLLLIGRLRTTDIGLQRRFLLNGVIITAFLWSLTQTLTVCVGRLDGGALDFGFSWNPTSPVLWAGLLDAHAGGALIEEVIYRGFLMPQVFIALKRFTSWSITKSLVAAVTISQLYFAVNHLPAAFRTSLPASEIILYVVQVFFVGVFFVAVYMRTGNLFVAIGIHALLNFPGALFISRMDPFYIVLVLSCAILIVWPYLNRSLSDVFTMRRTAVQPRLTVQAA
jgi:membrane protease YdiL (CAAX protease family)